MQYSEQCVRKNNNNNNKAKHRPALYIRTNAGKKLLARNPETLWGTLYTILSKSLNNTEIRATLKKALLLMSSYASSALLSIEQKYFKSQASRNVTVLCYDKIDATLSF
jgi:hypothetical protein